jgi:hypothetical protein
VPLSIDPTVAAAMLLYLCEHVKIKVVVCLYGRYVGVRFYNEYAHIYTDATQKCDLGVLENKNLAKSWTC